MLHVKRLWSIFTNLQRIKRSFHLFYLITKLIGCVPLNTDKRKTIEKPQYKKWEVNTERARVRGKRCSGYKTTMSSLQYVYKVRQCFVLFAFRLKHVEWILRVITVAHWTKCALSHLFLDQSAQLSSPEAMPYGLASSLLALCFAVLVNVSPSCLPSPISLLCSYVTQILCPVLASFLSPSFVWTHRCTRTHTSQLALLPPIFQGHTCAWVRALPVDMTCLLFPPFAFFLLLRLPPLLVSHLFNVMCGDQCSSSRAKDKEKHLLSVIICYVVIFWKHISVWVVLHV